MEYCLRNSFILFVFCSWDTLHAWSGRLMELIINAEVRRSKQVHCASPQDTALFLFVWAESKIFTSSHANAQDTRILQLAYFNKPYIFAHFPIGSLFLLT